MDNCYGKTRLNFAFDPIENGRLAAIFDFCYDVLDVKQVYPDMHGNQQQGDCWRRRR